MIILRVSACNILKKKVGPDRDFYIAFSISIILHIFVLFFFPHISQPARMESITVDFELVNNKEYSYNTNTKKQGQGKKVDKKSFDIKKMKSQKHSITDNKTGDKDNPSVKGQSSADIYIDSAARDKNTISTNTASLKALPSNSNVYGNEAATENGKNGNNSQGFARGVQGESFELSPLSGEGRANDYGYIRETVMKYLQYPEKARRFGWEGKVILHFIINEAGLVSDIKITRSSGIQMLDNAAKDALSKVALFHNKYMKPVTVQLPVEFKINQ